MMVLHEEEREVLREKKKDGVEGEELSVREEREAVILLKGERGRESQPQRGATRDIELFKLFSGASKISA